MFRVSHVPTVLIAVNPRQSTDFGLKVEGIDAIRDRIKTIGREHES